MQITIPQTLKMEHDDLHSELQTIMNEKGKVGEAARAVAKILHPHFVKEEIYALPPLGLLAALANGERTAAMKEVLVMTDRLRDELPAMMEEHKAIVASLRVLVNVARAEKKLEIARFAEQLIVHAHTEEEIYYPAALLVGEFVRNAIAAQPAA